MNNNNEIEITNIEITQEEWEEQQYREYKRAKDADKALLRGDNESTVDGSVIDNAFLHLRKFFMYDGIECVNILYRRAFGEDNTDLLVIMDEREKIKQLEQARKEAEYAITEKRLQEVNAKNQDWLEAHGYLY